MATKAKSAPRCAAIIGPYTSGKTTLLEAMLFAAGAIPRKGSVTQKNSVGDTAPEAREREMGVELNLARAEYLGEQWSFLDCPGSVELAFEAQAALCVADVAIVVAEAELAKVYALAPLFRHLDDIGLPHMVFINKMEKAEARIRDILAALQAMSARPLVLRQVPIREGDSVTGFVDLVSERAYRYKPGVASDLIEMPEQVRDREGEARQEMLEFLADFDDDLLEQLLEDKIPAPDEIYGQLTKDLQEDLIVPVFLGSAEQSNGVVRLWKALRHEAPEPGLAATRAGAAKAEGGFSAAVFKTIHLPHTGKLSLARIWDGKLAEGATIEGERLSGLMTVMGGETAKLASAGPGEIVGLARMDSLMSGDLINGKGRVGKLANWPAVTAPVFALAIEPENRQDEVKLSSSVTKLIEEDPSLAAEHNEDTHQYLLWGQGEIHLRITADRLRNKFNVSVRLDRPATSYKETIRKGTQHHARFKKQTGGHGQFADIKVEIKPLPRGEGFAFTESVVGGSVPRNYIPAVEAGVRDYLSRGPLGFPVVDVAVNLFDGQHHSVDSSDQAFRTAGRMAMAEALPSCNPVLLEPIFSVEIDVPSEHTAKVHGLISGRRGQILGFMAKEGWSGWDSVQALMPQSELHDLIVELRSLTQGLGTFTSKFDHLQELSGRLADRVIEERQAAAAQ
jgi:elongation factor G